MGCDFRNSLKKNDKCPIELGSSLLKIKKINEISKNLMKRNKNGQDNKNKQSITTTHKLSLINF